MTTDNPKATEQKRRKGFVLPGPRRASQRTLPASTT